MRKLLSFLIALALPALAAAQSNVANIQKGGPTVPQSQVSNGPITIGSGNSLTPTGTGIIEATSIAPSTPVPWADLTAIPSPTMSLTGDATTAQTFLATGGSTSAVTLATVNGNVGTFASVTVNGKGLVTAATNLSGDATTSGSVLTLDTVNSNVGQFAIETVNGKGLVTAATAMSGDVTTSGAVATLATVNTNTGSWGTATQAPQFTVNGKGLVTAAANVTVTPAYTNVTSVPTVSLLGNSTGGTANAQAITPADSVIFSGTNLQLSGDASAPGNSYFYGTNASGVKGWYLQSSEGPVDSITGTANQIAASASTGAVTLSIPSTFILPGTINGLTLTTSASGVFTLAAGKTLTVSNSLTFAGTDATTQTFPSVSASLAGLAVAQTWGAVQTFPTSDVHILGSSTGYTAIASANAGVTNYTVTIPAVTDTVDLIGTAQTFTAAKTFTNSDLLLLGSSTGVTTLASANAGASNFTLTLPAATDTVALLAASQTLTNKSIAGSEINSGLVGGTYGGTGVNNGAATITVGGNTAFSGAYTFTGTLTGNTSVTFPTSGTLSTTTGTVTAVSIATANGFSGSSSGGATPALTIVAGAITPTSVNGLTLDALTTGFSIAGGTTSKTLTVSNSLTLAGTDATTQTFPAVSASIPGLGVAQTWGAAQTFPTSDLILGGSSTGVTTFASANASATNYTITFPAATGTVALTSGTPTGANPTGTIAVAAGTVVNGSAATFLRSDGAPALPATMTGITTIDSMGIGSTGNSVTFAGAGSLAGASLTDNGSGGLTIAAVSGQNINLNAAGAGSVFVNRTSIATAQTAGLTLANTTASTSGATQQYAPASVDIAHVWNTTSTAADNYAQWLRQVTVTSGTSPTSEMDWYASISATSTPSYSKAFGVTSAGLFKFNAGIDQTFNPNSSFAGLNVGAVSADPGTLVNGDIWYNSTGNALNARINGATVSLGGGAVSSVSNSDGTLTISPTTGSVVASIALGHANTWTGAQTMGQGVLQATLDYVSVSNSTDQNTSGATALTISFDTNVKITNAGMHSTSSNPTRLIAVTAGWYQFAISPYLATDSTTSEVVIQLKKNGSTLIGIYNLPIATGGAAMAPSWTGNYYLNASDYVEIIFVDVGATTAGAWRNGTGSTYPQSVTMTKLSD